MINNNNTSYIFYLLILGIFLLIVSPFLLSDGMFMDGLIYTTLAKNLASGHGTFWNLFFTETYFKSFHEHPPLAMGLQSIFYYVFGTSRYIDKLYSIFTYICIGVVLIKIWKLFFQKYTWLPLLFWLSVSEVQWSCSNNMLENTLTIFTLSAIYFYFKSGTSHRLLFLMLAGFMLFLGTLTKGFVALYPWALPMIIGFVWRKQSFWYSSIDTILLLTFTAMPWLILLYSNETAYASMYTYFQNQVVGSIKSIVTVNSRFYILARLLGELIPMLILCVIILGLAYKKKINLSTLKKINTDALVFACIALCGVIPIMISLKQRGFYILSTYPLFALCFAFFLYPIIDSLHASMYFSSKSFALFKKISIAIFSVGVATCLFFAPKKGRDINKLNDMYTISSKVPKHELVTIHPTMFLDWTLLGYYYKQKNISMDPSTIDLHPYLLLQNNIPKDSIYYLYKKIDLPTKDYTLYKKELL